MDQLKEEGGILGRRIAELGTIFPIRGCRKRYYDGDISGLGCSTGVVSLKYVGGYSETCEKWWRGFGN